MHLIVTDSGLGGLAICAELEKALRQSPPADAAPVRVTYFNAWPEQASGYNDLADIASRARVFDLALRSMAALGPGLIVIACNTLSIVYEHTAFRRTPPVPVVGIVNAGIEMFHEALAADSATSIVLFGTRTTIESGVHRAGLLDRGIDTRRVAAIACHGLAKTIETEPDGALIAGHIERCTTAAADARPVGERIWLGVCCTHYTYVKDDMRAALERRCGRSVQALDPGRRMVADVMHALGAGARPVAPLERGVAPAVTVKVVSKVEMTDDKRRSMARRVEAISPETAAALLSYTRVANLF